MKNWWKDIVNLISKLTFRRFANGCRLLFSYWFSKRTRKNHHSGMPASISFEPTTACNLGCPECPSGLKSFSRPTGNLSPELFEKTLDELAPYLMYLILYFQGEPYIHPKLFTLIEQSVSRNIYTALSTNAHFLDEEKARKTVESGLDRLIISVDGTDQKTYEAYRRGGSLDKVIAGTKNILYWRNKLGVSRPYVIFQFLVVRPNEHQIGEVQRLADELGVDSVGLKTAQIYDYENGNPLIPTIDKYSRYKQQKDGTYAIKNTLSHSCWKMWHSCVITWDGKVVPCCFDKDAHYRLGDMQQESFAELWRGAAYQQFREQLIASRSKIEMCRNCTEGTKVWA